MKLSQIVQAGMPLDVRDCEITGLENDSRLVEAGNLFIAYKGAQTDGRLYIEKAVSAGAAAVVYDPNNSPSLEHIPQDIPLIPIPDLAKQLFSIAGIFYDNPSQKIQVTGVTGTNGKTTVAYQLAQAHQFLGQGCAYIGTIGQGPVNHLSPINNTTPDILSLLKFFDSYVKQGLTRASIEVSSHALSQNRVGGVEFTQALFTNLTQDHLDYHHTMQAYAQAKALLFAREELQYAIVNRDSPYHKVMLDAVQPQVKKLTYSLKNPSDVQAVDWHMDVTGTSIAIQSIWGNYQFKIQALGAFNIYNSLAVFSSLLVSGYSPTTVVGAMEQLKSAPGRMEVVLDSPSVLVDYAHTPDALEKALSTLNQLKKGRLWVVFGCGGDRDKGKRPLMGRAASLYADTIIVTSDNPRTEDPRVIIEEVLQGIPANISVTQCINREEAIAYALNSAEKEDIILIAGKGHEDYQQIGTSKQAFSDQEVVRRLAKKSKA